MRLAQTEICSQMGEIAAEKKKKGTAERRCASAVCEVTGKQGAACLRDFCDWCWLGKELCVEEQRVSDIMARKPQMVITAINNM